MTAIDKEYYQKRALQEREREKNAPDRAAAQVHAEMAEEYERMLRTLEDEQKLGADIRATLAQGHGRA